MTPSQLHERLAYDSETGALTWKRSPSATNSWNTRFAGKPAFTTKTPKGYQRSMIARRSLFAHRVAWAMHYGRWPTQIDHINGDKTDNRIANLREVGHQEQQRNRARPSTNTSGHVGVYWEKRSQRWVAKIKVDNRLIHLGQFADKAAAISARAEGERNHGFHPNHGR